MQQFLNHLLISIVDQHGQKTILTAKSSDYLGVDITVREEIVTEEATYARVDIKGKLWVGLIQMVLV